MNNKKQNTNFVSQLFFTNQRKIFAQQYLLISKLESFLFISTNKARNAFSTLSFVCDNFVADRVYQHVTVYFKREFTVIN